MGVAWLAGIFPPIATAFAPDGALRPPAAGFLEYLRDGGLDGVVALGSNGEAPHLSEAERVRSIGWVREALWIAEGARARLRAAGRRGRKAGGRARSRGGRRDRRARQPGAAHLRRHPQGLARATQRRGASAAAHHRAPGRGVERRPGRPRTQGWLAPAGIRPWRPETAAAPAGCE